MALPAAMSSRARRLVRPSLPALCLALAACAHPAAPPAARAPEPATVAGVAAPPEWRPGDHWTYDLTSGEQTTTKNVDVREIAEVNATRYYVVRVADADHYLTLDLRWAAVVRDRKVEARMVPPQPLLAWPLDVGRQWTHDGRFEAAGARTSLNDTFGVIAVETVEVPAGRFRALKIVRQAGAQESDQYWYAPDVRWYVKWIGRRGDLRFEERLREYRPAPR
jgi:hypothetical protein